MGLMGLMGCYGPGWVWMGGDGCGWVLWMVVGFVDGEGSSGSGWVDFWGWEVCKIGGKGGIFVNFA